MSYTVDDTTITMTRGDTVRISLTIDTDEGEYLPVEGDVVRFAAKKTYDDPEPLIYKVIPNDSLIIEFNPEDTKPLEFGTYVYDVELTYVNGDVATIIPREPTEKAKLIITGEVE